MCNYIRMLFKLIDGSMSPHIVRGMQKHHSPPVHDLNK